MSTTRRDVLRVAGLGVLSGIGVRTLSGSVAGAPKERYFSTRPAAPNLPARHYISFTPTDMESLVGTPLQRLTIEYGPDSDFDGNVSGVSDRTFDSAGIWRPSPEENTISTQVQNLKSQLNVTSASKTSLTITFEGEPTLSTSQYINLGYYGVTNPSTGRYRVRFSFNDGAVTVEPLLNIMSRTGLLASGSTTSNGTVIIPSAYLSDGGFLVMATQGPNPEAIGKSSYLKAGGHTGVRVQLQGEMPPQEFVRVVAFRDSNGNRSFDPKTDRPYLRGEDLPVSTIMELRAGGSYSGTRTPLPTLATPRKGGATGDVATATSGNGGTASGSASVGTASGSASVGTASGTGRGSYRGFFINNPTSDPIHALSNPQFLTVSGFLFSVAGLLHQMVKGR